MRLFAYFSAMFWLAVASPAFAEPVLESNQELRFILGNLSVLFEKQDSHDFPANVRLIQLPDRTDDCSWLLKLSDLPSSFKENNCPRKKLYLTFSNWDLDPDQSVFLIGTEYSWKVLDTVIVSRHSQSNWSAVISLEIERIRNDTAVTITRTLEITNTNDIHSVRFRTPKQ